MENKQSTYTLVAGLIFLSTSAFASYEADKIENVPERHNQTAHTSSSSIPSEEKQMLGIASERQTLFDEIFTDFFESDPYIYHQAMTQKYTEHYVRIREEARKLEHKVQESQSLQKQQNSVILTCFNNFEIEGNE